MRTNTPPAPPGRVYVVELDCWWRIEMLEDHVCLTFSEPQATLAGLPSWCCTSATVGRAIASPSSLSFWAPSENGWLPVSFLCRGVISCCRDARKGRPEVGSRRQLLKSLFVLGFERLVNGIGSSRDEDRLISHSWCCYGEG